MSTAVSRLDLENDEEIEAMVAQLVVDEILDDADAARLAPPSSSS